MIYLCQDMDGDFRECGPKESATHVFMTWHDYTALSKDSIYHRGKMELAKGRTDDLNRATKNADNELPETEKEIKRLQGRIRDLDEGIETKNDEINSLDCSNNNLRRIIKERSNAARGLRPKKKHSGYVPLRMDQIQVNAGYDKEDGPVRVVVWKTTIETPYPALICFEDIAKTVLEDLRTTVLADCGLFLLQSDLSEVPVDFCDDNIIYFYDAHFNKKDKTGLWNICVYSTKQLDLSQMH